MHFNARDAATLLTCTDSLFANRHSSCDNYYVNVLWCCHHWSVIVRVEFSVVVWSKAFSAVLSHPSVSDSAQPGAHQAVPEVRLETDIHYTGDTGSFYFGTKMLSVASSNVRSLCSLCHWYA